MICRPTHNPRSLFDGVIVDLFAGGGGASLGIERAMGRAVDFAINHDPEAVGMHRVNHPRTHHITQDVMDVDPRELLGDTPVLLLWASPDCTHHSKAKGGKPLRDRNRKSRDLAWVVPKWAGLPEHQRPRMIFMENVEEWSGWGPLRGKRDPKTGRIIKLDGTVAQPGEVVPLDDQMLIPCRRRKGRAFRLFVRQLRDLGYQFEWKVIRACDHGTPTIRKRVFLVARCDGEPIRWPEPTHGLDLIPYRTAAECIEWEDECPSIFTRRRPLAANTCRRIAAGIQRHVIDAAEPFIVAPSAPDDHGGVASRGGSPRPQPPSGAHIAPVMTECANASNPRNWRADEPLRTQTAHPKGGHHAVIGPTLVQVGYGERPGQKPRVPGLHQPLGTVVSSASKHALVAAWMVKHFGGVVGQPIDAPAPTQTTRGTQNQLVAAHLSHLRGTNRAGHAACDPTPTITGGGTHQGLVAALLAPYYGSGSGRTGRKANRPAPTVTTKDRLQLIQAAVTKDETHDLPAGFWRVWQFLVDHIGDDAPAPCVVIDGEVWLIVDIGMRMLQPRELYRAMGFPDDYAIDQFIDDAGDIQKLTKTASVRMCGNSVAVDVVEALVASNCESRVAA